MDKLSAIANVPNTVTTARLAGSVGEAVAYARTGELSHFIRGGAYFLLDVVDGPLARGLHQETDFGAAEDPIVDKASVAALGIASVMQRKADVIPTAAVAVINVSNTVATFVAQGRRTLDEGVTGDGKNSQFGMNTGVGMNVIGNHLRESERSSVQMLGNALRYTGGALALGSALLPGLRASGTYWRQALKRKA